MRPAAERFLCSCCNGNSRPAAEAQPWGNREVSIADPFGNRITFWTPLPQALP
jgi:uncharacterized glyoxalase superfamily protein PhnB